MGFQFQPQQNAAGPCIMGVGIVSKSLNEKGVDRQIEPSGLKKHLAYMT